MADRNYRLSIPNTDLQDFRLLAHVSDEQFGAIETAMETERPSLDAGLLANSIAENSGIEQKIVNSLVMILWRLTLAMQELNFKPEEILDEIEECLKAKECELWSSADAEAWSSKKEIIAKLLISSKVIQTGAKAMGLLMEQPRNYCKSRVITDIRPVFDDKWERVEAFLPFHVLAIKYHEGKNNEEIHFALDTPDAKCLIEQLQRAVQKERTLRETLVNSGFYVIESDGGNDA